MNISVEISKHLAKVIGRPYVKTFHDFDGDGNHKTFDPFNDSSEWFEVLLWAISEKIEVSFQRFSVYVEATAGEYAVSSNTREYDVRCRHDTVKASCLYAIANITGFNLKQRSEND